MAQVLILALACLSGCFYRAEVQELRLSTQELKASLLIVENQCREVSNLARDNDDLGKRIQELAMNTAAWMQTSREKLASGEWALPPVPHPILGEENDEK